MRVKQLLKKLRPKRFPYLRAALELGFMGFRTNLMVRAVDQYAYEYITISWYFFKWSGEFRLYKPYER